MKSQLNGKIIQTAYLVRDQIEDMIPALPKFLFAPDDLQGACGIASYTLHRCYNRLRISNKFHMGWYEDRWGNENHCWVSLADDMIVDITATQFNIKNRVHVAQSGLPYMPSLEGEPALAKLRKYWGGQAPHHYKDLLGHIENTTVQTVQNTFGK